MAHIVLDIALRMMRKRHGVSLTMCSLWVRNRSSCLSLQNAYGTTDEDFLVLTFACSL